MNTAVLLLVVVRPRRHNFELQKQKLYQIQEHLYCMARARNTLSTKGFHMGPTRVAPPRARGPGPEGRRQTRSWLGWQRGRGARGGTRPGREKKRSISVALALHCKRNPQAGWEVPLDPPRSPDPPVAAWAWGGEVAPPAPGPWHWQPGGLCLGGERSGDQDPSSSPGCPGDTSPVDHRVRNNVPVPYRMNLSEFPTLPPGVPCFCPLQVAHSSHTGPELVFLATCQSLQGLARGQ